MSVTTDAAIVLTALAGFPVIKRQPQRAGAPRPSRPYGTVEIQTSRAQSATPHSNMFKNSGQKSLTQVRIGTLFLDIYGDDAQEIAETLALSIRRRSARAAASPLGILITPIADVPRVPVLRDTTWDEVAQVQYQIQWLQRDVEAMERIETVETTLDVNPPDLGPNLLADGDMEAGGVGAWIADFGAILSKEPGARTGGIGAQILRITNTDSVGSARQGILVPGTSYRVIGWARGNGTVAPALGEGGPTSLWIGTPSTVWQSFDIAFFATGAGLIRLTQVSGVGTQYAEFDDVIVAEDGGPLERLIVTVEHTDTPP